MAHPKEMNKSRDPMLKHLRNLKELSNKQQSHRRHAQTLEAWGTTLHAGQGLTTCLKRHLHDGGLALYRNAGCNASSSSACLSLATA